MAAPNDGIGQPVKVGIIGCACGWKTPNKETEIMAMSCQHTVSPDETTQA